MRSLAKWGAVLATLAPAAWSESPRADATTSAAREGEVDVTQAVWALLTPSRVETSIDVAAVASAIAHLGPAAARPTLEIYVGLSAEPDSTSAPNALAIRARPQILSAALAALPRSAVLDEMDRLLATPAEVDLRVDLARILGTLRGAGAYERVLEITAGLDPIQWERTFVQEPLENALGALLEEDPRRCADLAIRVQSVEPALAQIYVRGLVRARAWSVAGPLTRALGRDVQLDQCLIAAVAEFSDQVSGALPDLALVRIRFLLDHRDAQVVAVAARTLALLGDAESAPRLIEMLDDPDSARRVAAHSALRTLSGASVPPDSNAWGAWLRREETWASETLPDLEDALAEAEPSELARGITELQQHVLYRHRTAALLLPLLASDDASIVRFACMALPAFRSGAVLPALRALGSHADADVRGAAKAALERLESPLRAAR